MRKKILFDFFRILTRNVQEILQALAVGVRQFL